MAKAKEAKNATNKVSSKAKEPETILGSHLDNVLFAKIGVKSKLASDIREVLSKLHIEGISVDFLSKTLGYSKIFLMLNLNLKRPKDMSKEEFYGEDIEDTNVGNSVFYIFAEDFEEGGMHYVAYLLEDDKTRDYYVLTVSYQGEQRELSGLTLVASLEDALLLLSLIKEGKPIGKSFDNLSKTFKTIEGFVSDKIKFGIAEELN
jgi:hypothetical protein